MRLRTQVYTWYMRSSDNIISNLSIKETHFVSLLNYVWINFNLQGDFCTLLLEAFFDVMCIFGSVEP